MQNHSIKCNLGARVSSLANEDKKEGTMTCRQVDNDEQPTYVCQKHQVALCPGRLKCRDPHLYCKFRSACMIHFLEKEHRDMEDR